LGDACPGPTTPRARSGSTPTTVGQVVLRFALDVGMIALTGTTNVDHMRADPEVYDFHLEPEEVERIKGLAVA
jgi:diketogulonate reductase-like aldo/keto reductase